MISSTKIVHLISDLSLGGVTKNLEIFDQDILKTKFASKIAPVQSEWKIATHYDADIIITHFSPSWANLPFLYALKKRNSRAKIIHMEHSYSPEWEAHSVPEPQRFRAMLKLSYAIFDHIICVSKTQLKWIDSIGAAQRSKLHVINPWSNIEDLLKLSPPKLSARKPLMIGSFGRLVREKGFEDLIHSFMNMPHGSNLTLLIGGYGPDEDYLKQLAKDDPRIKFYGLVDNPALFIEMCDIIAVPSYFETFGLVATEAKAAARPLLLSPVGSLVEQMGNAGQVIDFTQHKRAGQLLSMIGRLPLRTMSNEARQTCKHLPHQKIGQWHQFLNEISIEDDVFQQAV